MNKLNIKWQAGDLINHTTPMAHIRRNLFDLMAPPCFTWRTLTLYLNLSWSCTPLRVPPSRDNCDFRNLRLYKTCERLRVFFFFKSSLYCNILKLPFNISESLILGFDGITKRALKSDIVFLILSQLSACYLWVRKKFTPERYLRLSYLVFIILS